jgi:hypothetical protein
MTESKTHETFVKSNQENPPEEFFKYFEDMKKSEVIEMLWNRISLDERLEILMEQDDDDDDDEDDLEEKADKWFDRKYPNASCHRCEKKLEAKTVVFCGGGGGDCETWYCSDCHEDGTEDCQVCCSCK